MPPGTIPQKLHEPKVQLLKLRIGDRRAEVRNFKSCSVRLRACAASAANRTQ
jgi:hypothetical protein